MEKIYVCQFEQQNMDGGYFDPIDYCGYEFSCRFKREINGKRVCMKQPEVEVVATVRAASMTFAVLTVEDAAALVVSTLSSNTADKVDIRTPDWFASVDTSNGFKSTAVYVRGSVPDELRVILRSVI